MKSSTWPHCLFLMVGLLLQTPFSFASQPANATLLPVTRVSAQQTNPNKPLITPSAPTVQAKAYILIDVNSNKIIAEKLSDQKLQPASLTKMMTLYVVSNALHNGQIHLDDTIRISRSAWKTAGSRMFVKEGELVSIKDLLKGIIVDSGNDACVAMAEHLGGSEAGFVELMNEQAKALGMENSHFTDSTGLPNPQLYTTAKDLAILGQALVNNFPQYYQWYKQKWFTYNGIRQPNRNRLLWRDGQVDGIKTGHTDAAGFCLVSSAKRQNTRLLAVVLGAPSDMSRTDDSERLLNYGFRFFETHQLYQAKETVSTIPVFKGKNSQIRIGLNEPQYITIPVGTYNAIKVQTDIPKTLEAPIQTGSTIGTISVQLNDQVLIHKPLYALEDIPRGGFYTRCKDSFRLMYHRWFS